MQIEFLLKIKERISMITIVAKREIAQNFALKQKIFFASKPGMLKCVFLKR